MNRAVAVRTVPARMWQLPETHLYSKVEVVGAQRLSNGSVLVNYEAVTLCGVLEVRVSAFDKDSKLLFDERA